MSPLLLILAPWPKGQCFIRTFKGMYIGGMCVPDLWVHQFSSVLKNILSICVLLTSCLVHIGRQEMQLSASMMI
jgi:hypothetical protein